jgi:hypothetical protein
MKHVIVIYEVKIVKGLSILRRSRDEKQDLPKFQETFPPYSIPSGKAGALKPETGLPEAPILPKHSLREVGTGHPEP